MARLKHNGTEIARFERNFPQEDGWVLVAQHSVRLKTFKTKPAQVVIMRKVRTVEPLSGREPTPWSGWKMVATARTREGALKWHDRRSWTQIAGDTRREAA